MSTNYHTPYQDNVTTFRAADMNPPLASLDAQITANASAIDGKAAAVHTHDDRYYTETEIDLIVGGIGATHNHNDLYYTETELNTSGGGGAVHWDNVTNKPAAGTGDVTGPATNHADYVPQWNGADSKTLKDGLSVVTTIADPGLDTAIPTEQAVREAIASIGGGDQPYIIGGSFMGAPTASLVLVIHPFAIDVTFPAGLTNSKLVATVAATAETVFSLKKNGVEFGTATFAAAGTVATLAAASDATFDESSGDIFTLVAPATPDATLAGLGWAIRGAR
ncbi:MAG: hypothetical protein RBQ87_01330 [Candidatus Cloacimonadaceae bacterium]|jgi:hypothetical protein|nr:hypothetical protein [Candidatus Cloacimonadaceae bacterium]